MRRGALIFALVTFLGTSTSVLVIASPSGAATNDTNNQSNADDSGGGQYSGCPGFSATGSQGSSSSGDPSNAWGWTGNASPGSDNPPPDTDSESGGCPELVTDATPKTVNSGHEVTDVASFKVDPQGQVAFFVCSASATDCVTQGTYVGAQPLAADASGGSSAALTYTTAAAGDYCFFDVFHNADGTVPESTDDSTECFTVTQTTSGAPSTASSSSSPPSTSKSQDDAAALAAPAGPTTAAASDATPPSVILGATTVHTGEPWAGTLPLEIGGSGFGLFLIGFGTRRRRQSMSG